VDDTPEEVKLDFTKPVDYELVPADEEINSSSIPQNIYLPALALTTRFDLRYSQFCIMIQ